MADTASSRGYAWGVQTDYVTQKTATAGYLKRILASDENTIDYTPQVNNDEAFAHGKNQATEQWLEAHDCSISHDLPGYIDELGRVFYLNLGDYSVATPGGGTTSKEHKFKPQDPSVSRQGKAVTYAETTGPGWNVLMPRCVANGFSLRGSGNGILTASFGLQGAGKIVGNAGVTWPPTATPHVDETINRTKFFNTQIGLKVTPSGESQVTYGCRYRSFELTYEQTLLLDAGYKPGCADFLVPGDPTSGIIRSACEFDRQRLSFTFEVDMASGSPELAHVQAQKPIDLELTATGPLIEGSINKKLTVLVPVAFYRTTKPSQSNGIYTFTISGEGFFDYVTSKLVEVQLINTIATYASGW